MPPPSPSTHSFLAEQGKSCSRYTYLVSLDPASVLLCFPCDYTLWPGQHGLKCSLLNEVFLKIPELSVYNPWLLTLRKPIGHFPLRFLCLPSEPPRRFICTEWRPITVMAVGPQVVDVHKDFVVWCGYEWTVDVEQKIPRHSWEGSKRWHQAQQRSRNQGTVHNEKGRWCEVSLALGGLDRLMWSTTA